jgi:hypothetical protein
LEERAGWAPVEDAVRARDLAGVVHRLTESYELVAISG